MLLPALSIPLEVVSQPAGDARDGRPTLVAPAAMTAGEHLQTSPLPPLCAHQGPATQSSVPFYSVIWILLAISVMDDVLELGMGQIMSALRRRRRRKGRKKEKNKGRMKKVLGWVLGFFPGNTPKEITCEVISKKKKEITCEVISKEKKITCEMARFYSENHAHIVCEHGKDRYVTMMSFLAGKDVLELYSVPGQAKETQLKLTTQLLQRLISGILVRFKLIHLEGKTLNGQFSRELMCVPVEDFPVTPYIDVRFNDLPLDAFKPCTEEGGNLDLMRVGEIIQDDILSSETELPSELEQLLALLKSDPFSKRSLIYSHVSMKGLKGKLSYYMWMYKRLMYLKKKKPNKYAKIMQKINNDEDWRDRALKNKYLAMLRPFKDSGEQGQGGYSEDGKGKSRFYRNSVEHLPAKFDENDANLAQKNGTQPAPGPQQNIALPAISQSQPAANQPTAPMKPEAKRNGTRNQPAAKWNGTRNQPAAKRNGTRNQPAAKRNGTPPTTKQIVPHENGTQPAANQAEAQTKGAQSAPKRSQLAPSQPATVANETQPAANQAEAQRKGAQSAPKRSQLAPNQPATVANETQPAAQVNGAPPADTKETQQEPEFEVEEEEELEDYHAAIILLNTFPNFLGELQEAIFEESELENCIADGPAAHGMFLSSCSYSVLMLVWLALVENQYLFPM
ncbi:hypothetical protein EJB05_18034 [Eragrostis curvula]|uniref:Uncharacterized protein n=1 Tax=Eragrostis curvula TaxID=38414 RepID=A0A5J9VK09_9POAL|nr:hypothetical protein EJB05_18034 [Eragrostis curvula]